jgi:hypothetical protein
LDEEWLAELESNLNGGSYHDNGKLFGETEECIHHKCMFSLKNPCQKLESQHDEYQNRNLPLFHLVCTLVARLSDESVSKTAGRVSGVMTPRKPVKSKGVNQRKRARENKPLRNSDDEPAYSGRRMPLLSLASVINTNALTTTAAIKMPPKPWLSMSIWVLVLTISKAKLRIK